MKIISDWTGAVEKQTSKNKIMKPLTILALLFFSINGYCQNQYRVTAQTQNEYTENYWIDLYIEGNKSQYSTYINAVYYVNSNGLKKKISHSSAEYDGYAKGTYKVYIDGRTYYFKF